MRTKKESCKILKNELTEEQLHNIVETFAPRYRNEETKTGKKIFWLGMAIMVIPSVILIIKYC